MAQKRMFDRSIIDTERFYSLPIESQLLYFHLGLHADVKGFVEPRKIARLVGIKLESIQPLITLQFVIPFESGVVVISEWNQHNQIRDSREAPTRFTKELASITLLDNNIYQLRDNSGSTPAQYSIEKSSIVESREASKSNDLKPRTKPQYTRDRFVKDKDLILAEATKKYPHKDCKKAIESFIDRTGFKDYKYKDYKLAFYHWVREDRYGEFDKAETAESLLDRAFSY